MGQASVWGEHAFFLFFWRNEKKERVAKKERVLIVRSTGKQARLVCLAYA
jgi:hypothetical protein